ncbi:MAG: sugar transferase [Pseudomonadota bacterium]
MSLTESQVVPYRDVDVEGVRNGFATSSSTNVVEFSSVVPDSAFSRISLPGKRALDIVGALIGLVVFAPLFLVIFLLVRRDGGPALFKHKRVGRDGKEFEMLKFRSMIVNAEEMVDKIIANDPVRRAEWLETHKFSDDPRVTKIGDFLRRKSFDELPQLWNVLRGDMSLVGPRPIGLDEVVKYGPAYTKFISVRPGLTGLWQVNGRNDLAYQEKVALDVAYLSNLSWSNDVRILFRTVLVVLLERGAR